MSRLPVFEDLVWETNRHRGKLHYFTSFNWGDFECRLVMTLGVKKFHIDLYTADRRLLTLTVDMIDTSIIELERLAFGIVVYYLSQATPLVGAVQDPLPYWQH